MRRDLAIISCLALLTVAAYWKAWELDFVSLDDPKYITKNLYMQRGLTWGNVAWAFTALEASNWHPLTWLSTCGGYRAFRQPPRRPPRRQPRPPRRQHAPALSPLPKHDGGRVAERHGRRPVRNPSAPRRISRLDFGAQGRPEHLARARRDGCLRVVCAASGAMAILAGLRAVFGGAVGQADARDAPLRVSAAGLLAAGPPPKDRPAADATHERQVREEAAAQPARCRGAPRRRTVRVASRPAGLSWKRRRSCSCPRSRASSRASPSGMAGHGPR